MPEKFRGLPLVIIVRSIYELFHQNVFEISCVLLDLTSAVRI